MNLFLLFLLLTAGTAFGATSIMGGNILPPWKFAVNAGGCLFAHEDDYLSIADIGVRMGFPGRFDFGLKAFSHGVVADAKYIFIYLPPFLVTVDAELVITPQIAGGGAILLDYELVPFLGIYISMRLRYPVIFQLDTTGIPTGGAAVISRFGVEILRNNFLSFNLEGGFVTSWFTSELGITVGALVTWKI